MSKKLKVKTRKELTRMSINEIETYLDEVQNSIEYDDSEELLDLESIVREILLEKYED